MFSIQVNRPDPQHAVAVDCHDAGAAAKSVESEDSVFRVLQGNMLDGVCTNLLPKTSVIMFSNQFSPPGLILTTEGEELREKLSETSLWRSLRCIPGSRRARCSPIPP